MFGYKTELRSPYLHCLNVHTSWPKTPSTVNVTASVSSHSNLRATLAHTNIGATTELSCQSQGIQAAYLKVSFNIELIIYSVFVGG